MSSSSPEAQQRNSMFVVSCPHCTDEILIEQLNCCIFRHGVFKTSLMQIGPHTAKHICDDYVEKGLIYGCGKPFQVVKDTTNGQFQAVVCGYI
jgi:hypothetical protein